MTGLVSRAEPVSAGRRTAVIRTAIDGLVGVTDLITTFGVVSFAVKAATAPGAGGSEREVNAALIPHRARTRATLWFRRADARHTALVCTPGVRRGLTAGSIEAPKRRPTVIGAITASFLARLACTIATDRSARLTIDRAAQACLPKATHPVSAGRWAMTAV